eukprot:scaffold170820_cov31-Tisochrysis_lutea.AAC.5
MPTQRMHGKYDIHVAPTAWAIALAPRVGIDRIDVGVNTPEDDQTTPATALSKSRRRKDRVTPFIRWLSRRRGGRADRLHRPGSEWHRRGA